METTCMQIRAEEQDDEDKVNIALIGTKGGSGFEAEPRDILAKLDNAE